MGLGLGGFRVWGLRIYRFPGLRVCKFRGLQVEGLGAGGLLVFASAARGLEDP